MSQLFDDNSKDFVHLDEDSGNDSYSSTNVPTRKEADKLWVIKRREERKREEKVKIEAARKDALKVMKFLLRQSTVYSNIIKRKVEEKKIIAAKKSSKHNGNKRILPKEDRHVPRSKKYKVNSDDIFKEELILEDDVDSEDDSNENTAEELNLKYFQGALRPYQVEGVKWLKLLHQNCCNGILADEMGLGKTIQIIALISQMYENKVEGPYLIMVPLSTLPNWLSEFKKFAPKIPVVTFYGNQEERDELSKRLLNKYKFEDGYVLPVVLTSYQMPLLAPRFFGKCIWQYIIIDEGQCIKNHESKLALQMKILDARNKVLLTGTPLQNNLTELGSLLNFLMPHIFSDLQTFRDLLVLQDMDDEVELLEREKDGKMIATVRAVLEPFMLRRMKIDVMPDIVPKAEMIIYCAMTALQQQIYKSVLENKIEAAINSKFQNPLLRQGLCDGMSYDAYLSDSREKYLPSSTQKSKEDPITSERFRASTMIKKNYKLPSLNKYVLAYKGEANLDGSEVAQKTVSQQIEHYARRITMSHPWTMLKKNIHHPYLIHMPVKPHIKGQPREILVNEELVTQSGKMIVLDAMLAKLKAAKHKVLLFCTLNMTLDIIEEYFLYRGYTYRRLDGSTNLEERKKSMSDFNEDPDVLAFLISTRAGGLGLNLVGADTVVFFDRDWNPQVDLQAQARCHRIGQTKPIMVYSLITKGTIDEKILDVSNKKRTLEKLIMKKSFSRSNSQLEELAELLNDCIDISKKVQPNGMFFSDKELNDLLDRTEIEAEWKNQQEALEMEEASRT